MAGLSLGDLFQIGIDILSTVVSPKTKAILANTGGVEAERNETDNVEWWQTVGVVSRPPKPQAGKAACQGIVLRDSHFDVCIASRDLRGLELSGTLAEGETCIYGAGEDGTAQGRMLIKKDGMVALYTKAGNTDAGQGMGIFIDPGADTISITNSVGNGILIKPDGIYLTTGGTGSALTLAASGDIALVGTGKCQIDGGGIVLGSVAVPGVNSAVVGVCGLAGVASSKVLISLV